MRGKWTGKPVQIEFIAGAEPVTCRPFPVPHAYKALLKEEIKRLEDIGVLTKVDSSEWSSPSFVIPKKNNTIRFVTDFRVLNQKMKRKPYPLPLINEILQELGAFQFATCLDLNMGYYSMELDDESKKKCVTALPWGLYRYNVLPMGIKVAPDIFQAAMGDLFADMPEVIVYLDDVLIIGAGTLKEHFEIVDEVLRRLDKKGMQVNPEKSFWARSEVEYLGFLITRDEIKPQKKKIQGILNVKEPKSVKQVRSFVGMVNYYKSLWPRRSHILGPLTEMTGNKAKFKWTTKCTKAFKDAKSMLAEDALLAHPDYTKPFDIHSDASKHQIGGVLSQLGRAIGYFSRKFTSAQKNYTITGKELLSVVETMKYFRNIVLGHEIRVYTDHKKLTYDNSDYSSERILRQRLVIEEYGATIIYIKGENNVVADALSRLPISEGGEELMMLNQSSELEYNEYNEYNELNSDEE